WERPQHYGVDHAEDGCAGSDSKHECEDGHGSEAGVLDHHSHREAHIPRECFQKSKTPHIATYLPQKGLIAELPPRRIPRFLRRYSLGDVFFRLHFQMEPHLLFQFAVELISPRVEEQPAPEL